MLQFADIPRPAVGEQGVASSLGEAGHAAAGQRHRIAEKMLREKQHVLPPRPQWRHLDRHHVDPPEEVFPKPAVGHKCGEVLVRGEDHTGLHLTRL